MMNELQNQELQEIEGMEVEQREGFVVDNLEKLNWTFRKMSALAAKISEVKELEEIEIKRITDWSKKEIESYQNSLDFFTHKVGEYHAQELASNPRQKSIKTPYGTAKSTTSKASVEKVDESKLMNYVKLNELPFVETEVKEKLKWSDLKKTLHIVESDDGVLTVIDSHGEIVEGVSIKPETTKFTVEVSE